MDGDHVSLLSSHVHLEVTCNVLGVSRMRRYTHTNSRQAHIGVVGVGKSGHSSINCLLENNYYHADFILADTDRRHLNQNHKGNNQICERILLADRHSRSVSTHNGTKGNSELGKQATLGTLTRLKAIIQNYSLLFLFGGMGGGTATAALPIIAQAAAELNIMTIAIVTTPFEFEGSHKNIVAHQGVDDLKSLVDLMIVIHGDQLLDMIDNRVDLESAWAEAGVLRHRCIHIIEQMTQYPGIINIDFADVKTAMKGSGTALMTMGVGHGENRVEEAVERALKCDILKRSAEGASNVLIHIVTPPNHDFFEVTDITQRITDALGPQTYIKWGVSEDTCLHNEIRVMMVATGFCEITQIAHVNSIPMRRATTEAHREDNYAQHSLADHFWSLARDQMSSYSHRWN